MDKSMNLNRMAKEIHKNAVDHGWWNGPRDDDEMIALIHSEWSEALEEYRSGHLLVWYHCYAAEDEEYCDGINAPCSRGLLRIKPEGLCEFTGTKPEGIAPELIDGCIRILDMIRGIGFVIPGQISTADGLLDVAKKVAGKPFGKPFKERKLPQIISLLHWYTAEFGSLDTEELGCLSLMEAVGIAFLWISENGLDPVDIMIEKHEYNTTRPFLHGGKVC